MLEGRNLRIFKASLGALDRTFENSLKYINECITILDTVSVDMAGVNATFDKI